MDRYKRPTHSLLQDKNWTLKGAHLPNVYLNGEVILQVDSVKYLGHHLTNDLHDDLDIRRQCCAINVRETFFSGNITCVVYR